MSLTPTPEQLAAMAREYNTVRPITLPPPPHDELADLAKAVARLRTCAKRLLSAPGRNSADLARQLDDTVGRLSAQLEALEGAPRDLDTDAPPARSHTEALRQGLLAASEVARQLYLEKECRCLAGQLPFVTSLAHYAYSLLLTMTAF